MVVERFVRRVLVVVVALCALTGGAQTFTNCLELVAYSQNYHVVCSLDGYTGIDFYVDPIWTGGWRFGNHHTAGSGFVALRGNAPAVSYLDFTNHLCSVEVTATNDFYVAFSWNPGTAKGDLLDYNGWVHLRSKGDNLTLVASAFAIPEGERCLYPDDPPVEEPETLVGLLCWQDPQRGTRWYYTTDGLTASLGGGNRVQTAVDAKQVGGDIEIPDTIASVPVANISAFAFYGLDVERVTVPSTVTNISATAFSGTRLKWLVCQGDAPSVIGGDFSDIPTGGKVVVTVGTRGWLGGFTWHGLELEVETIETDLGRIYTNEVEWTETSWGVDEVRVSGRERLAASKGKTGWARDDQFNVDFSIYRIGLLPSQETREEIVSSNVSSIVEYWDLERVRSVRRNACWKIEVGADESDVFEGVFEQDYNEQGNLTREVYTLIKNGDVCEERSVNCSYFNTGCLDQKVATMTTREGGVSARVETVERFDADGRPLESQKTSRTRPIGSEDLQGNTVSPIEAAESITAETAEAALRQVDFVYTVPVEGPQPCRVSPEAYAGYFRTKVVQIDSEKWDVSLEIDPEAIDLPGSTASLASQLGGVSSGNAKTIVVATKPGLWYTLEWAESPVGPFEGGEKLLATSETTEFAAPPSGKQLFMRVVASAAAE